MSIELNRGDVLVCPHCNYEFDENVEDLKNIEGFGVENAEKMECEYCDREFLIIEPTDGQYIIEKIDYDDEEDDLDDYEDD